MKYTCLVCKETFERKLNSAQRKRRPPLFCSTDCYHKGQKLGLTSHKPRELVPLTCDFCGESFQVIKRKRQRQRYCGHKCYQEAFKVDHQDRSKKGYGKLEQMKQHQKCEICGFDRFVEICHIIPAVKGGNQDGGNILFLCPNHHRLFDNNLLIQDEMEKLPAWIVELYSNQVTNPKKFKQQPSDDLPLFK